MKVAYVALGSNIEPRHDYLKRAIAHLGDHNQIEILKQSAIYETEPVGYTEQGRFLNMVVQVKTNLSPFSLLFYCQQIESSLGRTREIRFGPRTVDLDILVYNQENIDDEQLTIPHPRMHERAFVLIPLAELCGELYINGTTVQDLVASLPEQEHKGVAKWKRVVGDEESDPFVN